MRNTVIAFAFLSVLTTSASAQVHRCKDATGKTIYSDQPCAAGQVGGQIERQRTRAEIMQEREQAYEAELRKQDRKLAEQERARAQQPRGGQPMPTAPVQQVEGWQERKDRENAATSARSIMNNGGRWDSNAEAARKEEARRRAAAAPPIITHCDPGFCYDNNGGVYHKSGPNFMTGPNGRTCHSVGTMWNCN